MDGGVQHLGVGRQLTGDERFLFGFTLLQQTEDSVIQHIPHAVRDRNGLTHDRYDHSYKNIRVFHELIGCSDCLEDFAYGTDTRNVHVILDASFTTYYQLHGVLDDCKQAGYVRGE